MFVLKRAFPGSPLHSGQCQVRVHNTTKPLGMPWGVTPRPRQDRAVRKALFQNTELTTKALEQGGDRPWEEQGSGAGLAAVDRQTLRLVAVGCGAAGRWAWGLRHWVPPLGQGVEQGAGEHTSPGARTTASQGRREAKGASTLWQGSTEQMSPTSRSCRDMSSSARSVQ